MKLCSKCRKSKSNSDFYKRDIKHLRSHCKECYKLYSSKRKSNKVRYDKERYKKNKVKIKSQMMAYYQKNKHKKKQYDLINRQNVYIKRKALYRSDIKYKLTCNLRSRLHTALKRNKKTKHTLELLGCSIDHLKKYLQDKFTTGMTWKKVMSGKIHIDHIKPCCLFDLNNASHQKKCFHYTNLQPLWAKDNRKKYKSYGLV